jgi:signal transduction histidine kinase
MKRRDAILALSGTIAVLLALLAVFAIELSNTQAKSKQGVESRVHERAVLAGALINSLFGTSAAQAPQDGKLYGGAVVSRTTLNHENRGKNAFLALYSSNGTLLASTTGFTAQSGAAVLRSGVLSLIAKGDPYGLGNVEQYGKVKSADYAVTFPTPQGKRTLVTGFSPQALSDFLVGDLREIPGVTGSHNYLIDGNDTVIASTYAQHPAGYAFTQPGTVKALALRSGDRNGRYYDESLLTDSTWRVLLTSPNGPLFASISGLHKWVPWIIFFSFALAGIAVLLLFRRLLTATDRLRSANNRSAGLNRQLATINDELEQRAAELSRSNADLEHFASIASHDLQEPLRKVRTYTEWLSETEAENLSEKGVEYLRRTNSAAERMQQLIEDLLRYSRVATHGREFTAVDLDAVIHEVLDDLSAQVERTGAQIQIDPLPTVMGDEPQLRQLLQNLLSNAMKFHRPEEPPKVFVHGEVSPAAVSITVRDNGIGFDPQYRQRIFRVFERLNGRSEYPGTGIGLALCRKIAERHGGEVIADSQPGEGSVFTVRLPTSVPNRPFPTPTFPLDREVTHVG